MCNSNPTKSGMGKMAGTLLCGFLLLFSLNGYATDVTGNITTNTTWNVAGSPYVLTGSVTVDAGVTLMVDPGVLVQSNQYNGLYVKGTLDVNGNSSSPVTFTGASTTPGWWRGILISDNGSAYLDYTNVFYGGYIDGVNISKSGSGDLTLNNSSMRHSSGHGLKISANTGALDANSCTFSDNAYSGVWLALNMSSDFIDDNAIFSDNPRDIGIAGGTMTDDATWDLSSSYSMYLDGSLTVAEGVMLTVASGTAIETDRYDGLFVQGGLEVLGTASEPVYFTGSTEQSAWWRGIQVSGAGTATLNHTHISYGGYIDGVSLSKKGTGSLTLNNSSMNFSSSHGLKIDTNTGALDANSCTFSNNAYSGVWLGLNMSSDFIDDNAIFSDNPRDIGIAGGTMTDDATWDLSSSYSMYLDGSLTVDEGAMLTVAPGTAIETDRYDGLFVQGGLEVLGTASEPVYFTGSTEQSAWWRGIQVSGAGAATLNHTHISYGGYIDGVSLSKKGTGSLTLNNSSMNFSSSHGLKIDANTGALDANSCTFSNNAYSGVWLGLNMSSDFIDDNVVFNGNPRDVGIAGGTMTSNATWDLSSNYSMYLNDSLTVADSAVLTIAPGTSIETDRYDGLFVLGGLEAPGTASEPVYFTGSTEQSAWWRGIQVSGAGTATLNHTHISYGGYINGVSLSKSGSGNLTLNNASLNYSSSHGLKIDANTGVLDANSCTFSNNAFSGVWLGLNMSSDFIDAASIFENNTHDIGIAGGTMDADVTWQLNPAYSMHLNNSLTVAPIGKLNIAPGTVIKSDRYDGLFVQGELLAQGTTGSPIYFTDARDDTVGGDANQDGDASLPGAAWWRGVQISGAGSATLKHAHIRYGGYIEGVDLSKTGTGSLSLINSTLTNSSNTGLYVNNSTGTHTLKGNLFADNKYGIKFVSPPAGTAVIASRMESNSLFGIHNSGSNEVDARNNWWGDATGPKHATKNAAGLGNPVSDHVLFDPWRTTSATSTIKAPIHSGSILQGDSLRFIGAASDDPSHTYLWDLAEGRSSTLLNPGLVTFNTLGNSDTSFALVDDAGSPDPNPDTRQFSVQSASSAPDMRVTSLQAPPNLSIGQSASISYSVKNIGSSALTGETWEDALYLSTDEFLDSGDQLLATKAITESLPIGSSYQDAFQIYVPAANEGQSYLIVSVDDTWAVLEQHQLNNESAASTSISVPVVQSGQVISGTLTPERRSHYYRIDVAEGKNILVTLDDLDNQGNNELYVRHSALPTFGDYDYKSTIPGSADQQILIPSAYQGSWYILVQDVSSAGSGAYKLTTTVSGLVLSSVSPNQHGNAADALLTISGAGFSSPASVSLVSGSTSYTGTDTVIDSYSQIRSTFAAGSVPVGTYSVKVKQSTDTAELANAFTMLSGGDAKLETNLIVPSSVGYHQLATIYVEYANTGNVAMPAPLLTVTATQNGLKKALMTLDASLVTQGLWTTAIPEGFSNTIQILANGSSPGFLLPGESRSIPIYYAGWQKKWDFSYPPIEFHVFVISADNTSAIDWNSLKDSARPSSNESAAWNIVWSNFTAGIGSTWGDYVSNLSENAAYLGNLGQEVFDVNKLLGFEFLQAGGYLVFDEISSKSDIRLAAPGMAVSFQRAYPHAIPLRFKTGPLGYGWAHPWDISLSKAADGTVNILSMDTVRRSFQPDLRGGFFTNPGDHADLNAMPDGSYMLQDIYGKKHGFKSDGKLDYVADSNGNRITCGYTSEQLTSLIHSSGQQLSITYNAANLISQITDSFGRKTTYSYDSSNKYLKSVQYSNGLIIKYSYEIDIASPSVHALIEIEHANGSHEHFSYNTQGKVINSYFNDHKEQINIDYSSSGKVSATDQNSIKSDYFIEHRGLMSKTVDSIGRSISFHFDNDFNLVKAIDPVGHTSQIEYDNNGNPLVLTDSNGHNIKLTHQDNPTRLQSLIDSRGNGTLHQYDTNGNIAVITLSDNSKEHFSYNTKGELTSWTNRRGITTTLTYDSIGHVTSRVSPTSSTTYKYDTLGNLVSTTADGKITSYGYDSSSNITSVTDQDNRKVQFTYNPSGLRKSLTYHDGFTVNYTYDELGRLLSLTNAADSTNIISYVYDDSGRLTQETKGNGTYTQYQYDNANQLTQISHHAPAGSINAQFNYTYDNVGHRSSMTDPDGTRWDNTYDAIGQLVSVKSSAGLSIAYEYDSEGNRISTTRNGASTSYVTNNLNQYTQSGNKTYTHDQDGNLSAIVENGDTLSFSYDAMNHLTGINSTANNWTYSYNALGQRTSATRNGIDKEYMYDPADFANLLAEYDTMGNLSNRFIYGLGLVSRSDSTNVHYYDYDAIGATTGITNTAGSYVNTYAYLPFGESHNTVETIANSFQYVGRYGVQSEDNELHHMGARYYHTSEGRFISEDPMGLGTGEPNLYQYAYNSPLEYIDPAGLKGFFGWIKGWANNYNALGRYLDAETEAEAMEALDRGNKGREEIAENADQAAVEVFDVWVKSPLPLKVKVGIAVTTKVVKVITGPSDTTSSSTVTPAQGALNGQSNSNTSTGTGTGSGAGSTTGSGANPGTSTGQGANPDVVDLDPITEASEEASEESPSGGSSSEAVGSRDPNQKTGPSGGGDANYVGLNSPFPYRIDFENDETAKAPAQTVIIEDQLHSNLDWSSFAITEVGFADHVIPVPANTRHFEHVEQMKVSGRDLDVRVKIDLNSSTGEIFALFTTIDPATGASPPVSVGFLPPEDGTGRGQGYFSYIIKPKADLKSGDSITNIAVITFDFGEVIRTDQIDPHDPDKGYDPAKQAPNTIDAEKPSSSVQPLPDKSSTNIFVEWQGQDTGGAGVGDYSIYVQVDNGAFRFWTNTSATSAVYAGATVGKRYGFYSRANDFAGNMEADKSSAEATTLVNRSAGIPCADNGEKTASITEKTYKNDEIHSCYAVDKITAGGLDIKQVVAEYGSSVTYLSSAVELLPIFRVETGATLSISTSVAGSLLMLEGPSSIPVIDAVRSSESVLTLNDSAIPEGLKALLESQQADVSDLFADPQQNYVLFSTDAALVEQDYNQVSDVYLYQTWLDKMVLISHTSRGASGNGASIRPRMDSLVQRIVFESSANNLVSGDFNAESDIFLIELSNGKMEKISGGHHSHAFNFAAEHPAMDGSGSEVLYDAVDETGLRQIYGYETQTDGTQRMSSLHNEGVGKHNPAISADGRYIAYLETTETEISCMVHVDDRLSGIYRKVTCPSALTGERSFIPYFSDDANQLEWREEIPYMIGEGLRNADPAVIRMGNPFMP